MPTSGTKFLLGYNRIATIPAHAFQNYSKLQHLGLDNNGLYLIGDTAFERTQKPIIESQQSDIPFLSQLG